MTIDWRRIEPEKKVFLSIEAARVTAMVWCALVAGTMIHIVMAPLVGALAPFISVTTGFSIGLLFGWRK